VKKCKLSLRDYYSELCAQYYKTHPYPSPGGDSVMGLLALSS